MTTAHWNLIAAPAVALVGVAVIFTARGWPTAAGLFPTILGVLLVLLGAIVTLTSYREVAGSPDRNPQGPPSDVTAERPPDRRPTHLLRSRDLAPAFRSGAATAILLFLATWLFTYLLGFVIGPALLFSAYLYWRADDGLARSVVAGLALGLALQGLVLPLGLHLPSGILLEPLWRLVP